MSGIKALEELREIAADINASEIVDHMKLYPSCVFDGAWLDAWHDEFYRAIDRLESEIAERFMELPVDAGDVPVWPGDEMELANGKVVVVIGVSQARFGHGASFHTADGRAYTASEYYHAKPRTVEDLNEEKIAELHEIIGKAVNEIAEEVAKRLSENWKDVPANPSGFGMKLTDEEIENEQRVL